LRLHYGNSRLVFAAYDLSNESESSNMTETIMTGGPKYAFAALVCYGLGDSSTSAPTTAGVKPHHF